MFSHEAVLAVEQLSYVDLVNLNLFQSVRQRESVLANLKANNADLERDVRRLQERKRLLERVSFNS
jgi:cell division protein FtsB